MRKGKRERAARHEVLFNHNLLGRYGNERGPWYETEAEIEAGVAWGDEKARLFKWVRKQMRRRLTAKQKRAIELYYLENLTFREVGGRMGCTGSAACRSVQRGIRHLRKAAKVDPPKCLRPRRRVRR